MAFCTCFSFSELILRLLTWLPALLDVWAWMISSGRAPSRYFWMSELPSMPLLAFCVRYRLSNLTAKTSLSSQSSSTLTWCSWTTNGVLLTLCELVFADADSVNSSGLCRTESVAPASYSASLKNSYRFLSKLVTLRAGVFAFGVLELSNPTAS